MLEAAERHQYSLDQWREEFAHIYGNVDSGRSPAEMWLLMMEDASHFAEDIRREKYGEALGHLAHVFCWACSFVSRCHTDKDALFRIGNKLSRIVWEKYPYACCLCGQERCICSVRRAELEELSPEQKEKVKARIYEDLTTARAREERLPSTLDAFSDMFSHIYKGAHYNLPIEAIVLHFMEEVGEVSTCIRKIRERDPHKPNGETLRKNLEEEIADVISWIASAVSKLDYILGAGSQYPIADKSIQTANLRLSDVVWDEFKDLSGNHLWCPRCKERPCSKCAAIKLYEP